MRQSYRLGDDLHVLPSDLPIPGVGLQPVNAFLLRDGEPLLVDTGMPVDRAAFLEAVGSLIDLRDLRWIMVTHDDRDHTGGLIELLAAAPQARVITNGTSALRLGEEFRLPADRVVRVNPGQRGELGGRRFTFLRPPTFDSPGTVAAFDHANGTLFSSDSFGTVLPHPAELLDDAKESDFLEGFAVFNRAIAPWVSLVDPDRFGASVQLLRDLSPQRLLSSHAPVATGRTAWLLEAMAAIPSLPPWLPEADLEIEALVAVHESLAG
jgi:glyoxylase-like metal-dependent hydrolase (beta-lactamase superfamily II)